MDIPVVAENTPPKIVHVVKRGNVGDDNEAVLDMNDANLTINLGTGWASEILKVTSERAFTADRTLIVPVVIRSEPPGGPEGHAEKRFVRNSQAGAFNFIVSTRVGTTVSIAQGKGAWIGVDTGGVFRMTADV